MVKKAILPESLNLTGEKIAEAIRVNNKVKKAFFG
jgi:hypothetical protein